MPKNSLKLLAVEQVVELAAAHGNQEEDIPHDDGQLLEEGAETVQIVGVVAADGGVDLDGNARLVGPLDGLDGARIGAGKAAESVVNLGGRAVQRDAEPDQARLLELENRLAGQQRRGAGGERHLDAFVGGVADQLEDVLALQRVAAGEDEDGHAHRGDLVDQRLPLGVGQLVGVGDGLGGGAAVLAGQVAGLGDLPDGEEGGFVKVQPATGGNVVHRLHETSCGIGAGGPGSGACAGELS